MSVCTSASNYPLGQANLVVYCTRSANLERIYGGGVIKMLASTHGQRKVTVVDFYWFEIKRVRSVLGTYLECFRKVY